MTPPPDPAQKLAALLATLRAAHRELREEPWLPPAALEGDRLVNQLIFSFMLWESKPSQAAVGFERLRDAMVDTNELRVSLPDEIAAAAGDESPLALERAARLRSALNDLYRRFHAVTLEPVAAMSKRDARASLAAIEGLTDFVIARLALLAFGGHAFPLDRRLYELLVQESALPCELPPQDASGWLERHFRAGEAAPAYLLIEAWRDTLPIPPRCEPGQGVEPSPEGSAEAKPSAKAAKRPKSESRKARTSTPSKQADA